MRVVTLALALTLTFVGCVDVPDAATPSPTPTVSEGHPFHSEGRVWFTGNSGPDRTRQELPLLVNRSGAAFDLHGKLGESYAGQELPTTSAQVTLQLEDDHGDVLGTTTRQPGGPVEMTLHVDDVPVGTATLAILVYGGSDGSSVGQYLDYVVDVV